jgi:hypothetical protein
MLPLLGVLEPQNMDPPNSSNLPILTLGSICHPSPLCCSGKGLFKDLLTRSHHDIWGKQIDTDEWGNESTNGWIQQVRYSFRQDMETEGSTHHEQLNWPKGSWTRSTESCGSHAGKWGHWTQSETQFENSSMTQWNELSHSMNCDLYDSDLGRRLKEPMKLWTWVLSLDTTPWCADDLRAWNLEAKLRRESVKSGDQKRQ